MIKAEKAVAYLSHLGHQKDQAVFAMPTMQLALYYVQATGLGWYGKPLLKETFVAGRIGPKIPRLKEEWHATVLAGGSRYLPAVRYEGRMPRWIQEHLDWVFEHYVRKWLTPPCDCTDMDCSKLPAYDTWGGERDWVCDYVRRFLSHVDDTTQLVIPEALMQLYYQSQFKIWAHPDLQEMKEYTP